MGCVLERIGLRSSTQISPKSERLSSDLTDVQKSLIRNNWHVIRRNMADIGVNTFIGLFESKPELKQLFTIVIGQEVSQQRQEGLLRKHSLRIMTTIDSCIINIDDPHFIRDSLQTTGMQHAKSAVPSDQLKSMLPHFLDALKPYTEDNLWCDDLEEAWSDFFDIIIYQMQKGMSLYKDNNSPS